MTTFPGSPKLLNGGIVLIHSATALRQMDKKYNGVFNLNIGSRTISAIKQFGFGQLSIHSR